MEIIGISTHLLTFVTAGWRLAAACSRRMTSVSTGDEPLDRS